MNIEHTAPLGTTDPELAALIELRLALPIRDGDDVVELMTRVGQIAVQHIDGADHAGITALFDGDKPFTVAPTDERVEVFDRSQYLYGDGPCLLAARTDRVVAIDVAEIGRRWPDLAITAHQCGISRIVAAPLHRDSSSVGSLNLYTDATTTAVLPADSAVLVVLLGHLDRGLGAYSEVRAASEQARGLQDSVEARALIDHAIGVITESTRCSYDAAVDALDAKSRTESLSRREAAARIVTERAV